MSRKVVPAFSDLREGGDLAMVPKSEYLGFTVDGKSRIYAFRVTRLDGDARDYTLSIPINAFVSSAVSYQDGPGICFLKLEESLEAHGDGKTGAHLRVTGADLDRYLETRGKKKAAYQPHPNVKP